MDPKTMLNRLAAELVDGRSLDPLGGAPWSDVAGELDHLYARGFTLADLAVAVRLDLAPEFPEGS